MALLDMIRPPVDEVTGQARRSKQEGGKPFTLEEQNFDVTNGSNLVAGQWVDAAEFIVEAQTAYNIGFGSIGNEAGVGRFYAYLDDGAGNQVTGQVRIKTRDANDESVDTEVASMTTSRLNADFSDYRTQQAVPEVRETDKVGEDSKVVFQFKLDSGSTGTSIDFSAAATEFALDMTRYS